MPTNILPQIQCTNKPVLSYEFSYASVPEASLIKPRSVELQMPTSNLEVLRKPVNTDMDIAAHAIA